MLKKDCVLLFQGDSITDCYRTDAENPDESLGKGYPAMIAEMLKEKYAELNVTVYNRGISGNRTKDLINRWDKDCIDLKPDYISLLIGINDTWRAFDINDPTSAEQYEENMRVLLNRIKNETEAEILILNPFLLDSMPDKPRMRPDLVEKQAVVAKLVKEFETDFIDLQKVYDEMVANGTDMVKLSEDGVHPTEYGHSVIADVWMKHIGM